MTLNIYDAEIIKFIIEYETDNEEFSFNNIFSLKNIKYEYKNKYQFRNVRQYIKIFTEYMKDTCIRKIKNINDMKIHIFTIDKIAPIIKLFNMTLFNDTFYDFINEINNEINNKFCKLDLNNRIDIRHTIFVFVIYENKLFWSSSINFTFILKNNIT